MLRSTTVAALALVMGCSSVSESEPEPDSTLGASSTEAFGENGYVETGGPCQSVAPQSDGKVVLLCSYLKSHVRRFLADGSVDHEFGDTATEARTFVVGSRVRTLPDDSLVVLGNYGTHLFVQHLDRNGHLDTAFGTAGTVTLGVVHSGLTNNHSFDVSPKGTITVAGAFVEPDGTTTMGARELGSDGRVLTSFSAPFTSPDVTAVLYDSDGRLLIAGETGWHVPSVARFVGNALDPAFGHGGVAAIDFTPAGGNPGYLPILAVGPGAVYVNASTANGYTTARLLGNGSVDHGWGEAGFQSGERFPIPAAVDAAGRALVSKDDHLEWLNADGSLAVDLGALRYGAQAPAVASDGKVFMAVQGAEGRGGVERFAPQ